MASAEVMRRQSLQQQQQQQQQHQLQQSPTTRRPSTVPEDSAVQEPRDESRPDTEGPVSPGPQETSADHVTTLAWLGAGLKALVTWTYPLYTAASFVLLQGLLYCVDHYSLVSVTSFLGLSVLTASVGVYIYRRATGTGEDGHVMRDVLEPDIRITDDEAVDIAPVVAEYVNGVVRELRRLFFWEDTWCSVKFVLALCTLALGGPYLDMHVLTAGLYVAGPMVLGFRYLRGSRVGPEEAEILLQAEEVARLETEPQPAAQETSVPEDQSWPLPEPTSEFSEASEPSTRSARTEHSGSHDPSQASTDGHAPHKLNRPAGSSSIKPGIKATKDFKVSQHGGPKVPERVHGRK